MKPVDSKSQSGRRLRIAVLNRNFSPTGGGAERYSIALVEQLSNRHEIHVFAQNVDHNWPGVSYHQVGQPFARPRWINQLWFATATWWVTRRGFDVVHSHENTWHGQVQTVHVLPIKYNLFLGRSGLARAFRWLKVITSPRLIAYLWLEHARYAAKPGRILVVTSATLQNIMEKVIPHSLSMLRVLTPGVNQISVKATAAVKNNARGTLGLPEQGQCLLFVGNDYQKKGLTTLLDALSYLPSDFFLVVVGNPAQIPAYRNKVLEAKLERRVFFIGALHDISPAYLAADCLVHPTQEDTFAMVVLEAMAHGLPVIVSSRKYCGIAELLTHGWNALILQNPTDALELKNLIQSVFQVVTTLDSMSCHAIDFAETRLWSTIASQQESIYYACLEAPDL